MILARRLHIYGFQKIKLGALLVLVKMELIHVLYILCRGAKTYNMHYLCVYGDMYVEIVKILSRSAERWSKLFPEC